MKKKKVVSGLTEDDDCVDWDSFYRQSVSPFFKTQKSCVFEATL